MKHRKSIAEMKVARNSKSPVEDTVFANWEDILECFGNGFSYDDIADGLRDAGWHVGNIANTGFSGAVKRIAHRKGVDLSQVKNDGVRLPVNDVADCSAVLDAELRPAAVENIAERPPTQTQPSSFADGRHSSDF